MRVLLAGAGGMLARDLRPALEEAGFAVTGATRADLDITDPQACARAVAGHDVVVNAAAWTAVDDAETQEPQAFAVNATGAGNLARAAAQAGAALLHVSTDYVFPGDAQVPYAEDAPTAPRSAYGRTKLAGEWAVRSLCPSSWVVRTSWLYGAAGPSFVRTIARLATERDELSVVDDQRGQPTWTRDLADGLTALIAARPAYGTYHATGAGETTWFGFARGVLEELGLDPARVLPTTTDAFPRPAPRPAYSVLGHDAWTGAGLARLPDWRESLTRAVPEVVAGRPTAG
ncbi:dTDP-4-dehydrorhamnose reductase [Luteipulveratus sp. YIM 133132]|uniref:dTDP-4-dehydrorhamnose reductase n=1 Tax=Luteipulveratus flavus TaxID=3031728 RepID=UPI0023B11A64|nr:dTDP-4-dehydrorhamnose reductase [Luteipulveratus sp. YIM 133132]MDE9365207.1 dTDP-4-dehydrorhamnose reductase [Luteipulveratus sp. YIM 133132]